MAQEKLPKKVRQEIDKYLKTLKAENLPIEHAVVFGSYAKGKQNPQSDIDLCIVSPQFENSFFGTSYLWSRRKLNDPDFAIEPIGFSSKDFESKFDSIVHEIKTTGIEIPV